MSKYGTTDKVPSSAIWTAVAGVHQTYVSKQKDKELTVRHGARSGSGTERCTGTGTELCSGLWRRIQL